MGMLSESSSPRHSNFINAAIARTPASNALNMGRILLQTLPLRILNMCALRWPSVAIWQQQRGRNRPGRPKSVGLVPVAANPYIDFEGNR